MCQNRFIGRGVLDPAYHCVIHRMCQGPLTNKKGDPGYIRTTLPSEQIGLLTRPLYL